MLKKVQNKEGEIYFINPESIESVAFNKYPDHSVIYLNNGNSHVIQNIYLADLGIEIEQQSALDEYINENIEQIIGDYLREEESHFADIVREEGYTLVDSDTLERLQNLVEEL